MSVMLRKHLTKRFQECLDAWAETSHSTIAVRIRKTHKKAMLYKDCIQNQYLGYSPLEDRLVNTIWSSHLRHERDSRKLCLVPRTRGRGKKASSTRSRWVYKPLFIDSRWSRAKCDIKYLVSIFRPTNCIESLPTRIGLAQSTFRS